jgi:anti-sigma factor RsiW
VRRQGRLARARSSGVGPDPHTLVGAYVMDAVTEADRQAFEHHMAGCETCQAEVRGLRETTARLAAAAEVRPRAALREQTVQAAGLIRQLPPPAPAGESGTPRPPLLRRLLSLALGTGRVSSWLPRVAVVAAAAFALVAAGMGAAMNGAEHQLNMAQDHSHAIAAVLGAPDATMMTRPVSTGGSATVVMSHRAAALVFTAADLRPLPSARAYELWLMSPSGPRAAGLLPAARHGMTGPMVVSGLAPGDEVGLTVEPAGGTTRPTSPPILMIVL